MDLFDEVFGLVTGIVFIIFSVYGLKNIDNVTSKGHWFDERVFSYKSKIRLKLFYSGDVLWNWYCLYLIILNFS